MNKEEFWKALVTPSYHHCGNCDHFDNGRCLLNSIECEHGWHPINDKADHWVWDGKNE